MVTSPEPLQLPVALCWVVTLTTVGALKASALEMEELDSAERVSAPPWRLMAAPPEALLVVRARVPDSWMMEAKLLLGVERVRLPEPRLVRVPAALTEPAPERV